MSDRILPDRPDLEQYKKQAKELLRDAAMGLPPAIDRLRKHHPRFRDLAQGRSPVVALTDAQFVLAREHGYESWPKFAQHIKTISTIRTVEELDNPLNTFIEFACVDRHGDHASGTLEQAEIVLARYPEVAKASIYSAAVLGDEATVRTWLARNPSLAGSPGGPHNWDALTYLCFSRYLRLDKARSALFLASARALLEAGASANTGWTEYIDSPPRPVPESAIYGAAGIAKDPGMTKLLLEFGADPNDEETPYHVPETYDNAVLQVLLDSGRFNERSLATVAARKCDWHEIDGLKLALEHGANPNYLTVWKYSPFQQSIRRDNRLAMIEMLLDHGADPYLANNNDGRNGTQMAASYGRRDILEALDRRGYETTLNGVDGVVSACVRGHLTDAQSMATQDPQLLTQVLAMGGPLLARVAGTGNVAGVRCLLAVGISALAVWPEGDPYWGLAHDSTALHVAAWRAHHEVVDMLIAAGASVNARDARGRTALQLAVNACMNSYWMDRRQPDSVASLLAAGATTDGIQLPTGYEAIDQLLLAVKP